MARLPELLESFEANVIARGGVVHWARDADEANRIIHDLVKAEGVDEVVKVKSMATQEIGMNKYLEEHGTAAYETDLAELIVQLGHDKPSQILVPAIHKNRTEVRNIFLKEMPDVDPELTDEPRKLAMAARSHLRAKFLTAKVAISGANFGIADSGTLGVVETEGNGRMCLTLPETLIIVMGIEKLLPTFSDLEVFLQLLPRSSTGERMNPYTSLWTGVTEGDGPSNFHVILLENGRTSALADKMGRVCPVKININIPDILVDLRGHDVDTHRGGLLTQMDIGLKAASWMLSSGKRLGAVEKLLPLGRAAAGRDKKIKKLPGIAGGWTQSRDIPALPSQSFRDWWAKEHQATGAPAPKAPEENA